MTEKTTAIEEIRERYDCLSDSHAHDIHTLLAEIDRFRNQLAKDLS